VKNPTSFAKIPFNRPYLAGGELEYIVDAVNRGHLSGDGEYTKRVHRWLADHLDTHAALLTHSCTAALEMAALLTSVEPGDEVILPSFTFVSTANAFVLRGAVPVFVDSREDTLNLDERLVEAAITRKTRGIVPVHYAGVACDMESFESIANNHDLWIVEDAAQALGSTYKGKPLGTFGSLGALSFHETKNIISGEGGALLINDPALLERAEIIREKGTDRSKFLRGAVDKYTWVDIGSSYLPSEMVAAFLWAQLQHAEELMTRRLALWNVYHDRLAPLEAAGRLRRPIIPAECQHNAHMYYVLLPTARRRDEVIEAMREAGIGAIFHYVPLHSSTAGRKYGRFSGSMTQTDDLSSRLVRLPMFYDLDAEGVDRVIDLLDKIA
jgi:dTDP-4-amino-4,6-dideoxygalactose transaminase